MKCYVVNLRRVGWGVENHTHPMMRMSHSHQKMTSHFHSHRPTMTKMNHFRIARPDGENWAEVRSGGRLSQMMTMGKLVALSVDY
jgi:hypothetical protein